MIPPIMPPPAPKTTVQRFRKFGAYSVCDICDLALDYCKGRVCSWAGDRGAPGRSRYQQERPD
jgi:hypothetical protein